MVHKNHPMLAFHNIAAPVIFTADAFICVLSGKASLGKAGDLLVLFRWEK